MTGGVTTRQQAMEGAIHPVILHYDPWSIINWRVETTGSRQRVTLVVLAEQYVEIDDGFEEELRPQCRELRWTPEGPTVQIWRKVDNGSWSIVEGPTILTGSDGRPLEQLPFIFLGAERNGPEIDASPILDIADLNLSHYNTSADYEDSSYLIGQPMYLFTGLTEHWVNEVLGGTIEVGSAAGLPLPVNADGKILQPDPNTMAKDSMEHKEAQMRALGAKLIEPEAVQQTATEVMVDEASESSILSTSAINVSNGITQALRFAALFAGETNVSDEALAYELSTDFSASRMSAQDRAQLIAEWQGGAMTFMEMRWNLRRAGLVYIEDEMAREEIASELPPLDAPAEPNPAEPNNAPE